MSIAPHNEQDDDRIAALSCARHNARTSEDAAAVAWAEEEIEQLRSERETAVREVNAWRRRFPESRYDAPSESIESDRRPH